MAIERIRELSYTRRETMKKQIVNNKVLRGVAIAMSVMMAITSVPVGAFAAGEEGQTTEETVSIEDGIEACGVIDDITSPDEDNDNVIPVTEVVEEAIEATEQIKDEEISENLSNVLSEEEDDRVEIINEAVSEYKDNLNEIKGKVADADNAADRLAETVSSTEKTVDEKMGAFQDVINGVSDSMASLGDNMKIVNDENSSQEEATKAAAEARKNIASINQGIQNATKLYEDAGEAVKKAQEECDKVEAQYSEAQEMLTKAKEGLAEAKDNATAANEYMKAAQSRVNLLGEKAEEYNENKEELEAIQNQYYGLFVQYYNKVFEKDKGKIVYNEDGSVDVAATAKNIDAETMQYYAQDGLKEDFFKLGRHLLKQLVTYELNNDESVDPESIQFGLTGGDKNAAEAKINQDKNGNDISVSAVNGYKFKMQSAGISNKSPEYNYGRTNRVEVTYNVKVEVEGKEPEIKKVTKYYNYIIKNPGDKFKDDASLENGMIYLAEIEKDENGKWQTKRVIDENNFDDYQKLVNALDTASKIEEYQAAKEAVDKAAAEVARLEKEVDMLQKVSIDTGKLKEAQSNLDNAMNTLERYSELKMSLENYLEEISEIDLSKYPEAEAQTPQGETSDDEGDDSSDDTAPAEGGAAVLAASETFVLPARQNFTNEAGPANGVLGVRVNENNGVAEDQGTTQIADNQVARAAAAMETKDKIDKAKKNSTKQNVKKVNDSEIPLAAIPNMDDEVTMNWMWLLIIFLLGATGKKMYDEYKKKKEEEETRRNKPSM